MLVLRFGQDIIISTELVIYFYSILFDLKYVHVDTGVFDSWVRRKLGKSVAENVECTKDVLS